MKQKNYSKKKKKKKFLITKNINLIKFDDIQELDPPLSFKNIYNRPEEEEWLKAVDEELNNMKIKKYIYIIYIPDDKNIISSRWDF